MAFDFLKNIFGEKKKTEEKTVKKEKKTLKTANLLAWLNSQLAKQIGLEKKKFSSISQNLLQMLLDLQKNVENIRKKTFEAGDRTYAAVNMIKETWAKKALMSFSLYNKEIDHDRVSPEKINFPVFRNLYHSTVRLMNEISMLPRQKIVMERYFESESKKIRALLKSISLAMEEIRGQVTGTSALKNINETKKMLDEFAKLQHETQFLLKGLDENKSKISEKREELDSMERKRAEIEKSQQWQQLHDIEKELKSFAAKKSDIEFEVSERLGSMKRTCRKFAHDFPDLAKEERRMLENLSHSPLKTFISHDAGAIENVLAKMENAFANNDFKLPEKDREKIRPLRSMLADGWVRDCRMSYDRIIAQESQMSAKKDDIKILVQQKESERLHEKLKLELEFLAREGSSLARKSNEKKGELLKKKDKIVDFVRKEIGSEVELV